LDDPRFSSHAFHGIAEFAAQMRDMVTTDVAQFDTFELRPEPFVRVQLGA
jgi:hypothetical protein